MRGLLNHWTAKTIFALGFSAVAAGSALGQAQITAQRGAELAPFVQTTLAFPDWGPTNNIGYMAGLDYTRILRSSILEPGLEVRFSNANGSTIREHTISGGLRLATTIGRIHPYGTALLGKGWLAQDWPTRNDYQASALLYSYGGGAEIPVSSAWKVRADYIHQRWSTHPNGLTPVMMSIGVSYRIPFGGGHWEH